jgi:magnesium transporter
MSDRRDSAGEFLFFSSILGRPVIGAGGERLGRAVDLVAAGSEVYPGVESLVVGPRPRRLVPWGAVGAIGHVIRLTAPGPFPDEPRELPARRMLLARQILDRQIVDTLGAKVVRVNDLHFLRAGAALRLVHVDVGVRGLVRRLGWERFVDGLVRSVRGKARYLRTDRFVSWKYVHPLEASGAVQLHVAQRELSELHPADLAEILEDLDREQRAALFETLPIETAADALEEAEPRLQRELLEQVEPEKAADIVEAMAADDAADLLGDLPEAQATEILSQMEGAEAAEVRGLLAYDESTAGGLMSPEFIALAEGLTAEQAIGELRVEARKGKEIYYMYVTAGDGTLLGVLSLRELIIAEPVTPIREFMRDRPVVVTPDASLESVAEQAAKYSLLAVPVADAAGKLLGIVTIDDVFDRLMKD